MFRVIVGCKNIDKDIGEELFKEVGSPIFLRI